MLNTPYCAKLGLLNVLIANAASVIRTESSKKYNKSLMQYSIMGSAIKLQNSYSTESVPVS